MTPAQEQVRRGGELAWHEARAAENYLGNLLPPVTAGGVGNFLGFRGRNQTGAANPAV